jgi:undecaprenyl diphosphate synthase
MKVAHKIKSTIAITSLNQLNLPNSLLIIPDGNGRWAKLHHFATEKGHQAGGHTLTELLEVFVKLNTKVLGVWGFSEDNWKREKKEIDNIMQVVKDETEKSLVKMQKYGVKFLFIGKKEKIKEEYPQVFQTLIDAQAQTANNSNKIFAVFLDYGERWQLEEFAKARVGDQTSDTYQLLSKINAGLPMFDMILRTSGEQRVSGFGPLASLAEYVSVKKNLPDLRPEDVALALKEYSGRQRRFGGR